MAADTHRRRDIRPWVIRAAKCYGTAGELPDARGRWNGSGRRSGTHGTGRTAGRMRGGRAADTSFCGKLMTIETETKNLNKAERVQFVLQRLQELYPDPPIPLDHKDAYTLLVAVLLSAQCTDLRVNQVTPALWALDRKSTRLNSSHVRISYAVFCLKKKK